VLTASYALREAPDAASALDLGTGIGTVGLLVLWGLGDAARLVCIEAQPISHRLLLANIAATALDARVEPHLGDLRDFDAGRRFALVTGSPPYFPLGAGVLPQDAQRAHARFEMRGDVTDYARAAERHLADTGVYVFCFPTAQRDRALAAVRDVGLVTTSYRDVIPRVGLRPLFTLFACRRSGELCIEPPLPVRDADGNVTAEMLAVRRGFGFPA
jgi:tRNA1(Val) A37 N6-methylase TrmN6